MKIRRRLAGLSACAIMLSSLTVPIAHAASFTDTDGHWAEDAIERWAEYKIVQGFNDNTFNPNASMTRAQMATVLAKLLGLKETVSNPFTDVASGAWYEEAILQCAAAGIMKGTSDTTASPNNPINRQQASTMLARALGIAEETGSLDFADSGDVSDWAAGYVKAMAKRGILEGVGDNQFAPKNNINRASVVTILNRAISVYANTSGQVEAADTGITLIAAPDVTLTGKAADVLIAPAAEGTTKLEGTTVSGAVTVTAPGATVDLTGTTAAAQVVVAEQASNATVKVDKGVSVDDFTTRAANTKLEVNGKISTINLPESASQTAVAIAKDATIGTINSAADTVNVTGSGKVTTMNVTGGKGVTVAKTVSVGSFKNTSSNSAKYGDQVIAASNPTDTTTRPSSGGNGGSSGGGTTTTTTDTRPADTKVTVQSLEDLIAKAAEANGTVSNIVKIEDANSIKATDSAVLDFSKATGSVTLDLNGQSLGDITIKAPETGSFTLIGDKGTGQDKIVPTIDSLVINTPNADFALEVPVTGNVEVQAVKEGTLTLNCKIGALIIAAIKDLAVELTQAAEEPNITVAPQSAGKTIKLKAPATNAGKTGTIAVNAPNATLQVEAETGVITGNAADVAIQASQDVQVAGNIAKVTATGGTEDKPVAVTVAPNAVVDQVVASSNTTVTGAGSVKEVQANAPTKVAAKTDEVKAAAEVTLAAPVEKITVAESTGDTSVDIKAEAGTAAKVSTIEAQGNVSIASGVKVTDKVEVTKTATVTVASDVTIPLLNTNVDTTIAGGGTVTTVAVTNEKGATITGEKTSDGSKPTVSKITTVGNTADVTPAGTLAVEGVDIVKAAPAPDATTFAITHPYPNPDDPNGNDVPGKLTIDKPAGRTFLAKKAGEAGKGAAIDSMEFEVGTYEVWTQKVETDGETEDSAHVRVTFQQGIEDVAITPTLSAKELTVGKALTAVTNPVGVNVTSYQWNAATGDAAGSAITGETHASLVASDAQVGKTLTVTATGVNPKNTITSAATAVVTADMAPLTKAIAAANAVYNDTSVEVKDSETAPSAVVAGVKYVTAANRTDFKKAIDAAQNIVTNDGKPTYSDTDDVTAQVNTLNAAVKTYQGQIQTGTNDGTDALKAELNTQLGKAETAMEGVKVSDNGNNVAPDAYWIPKAVSDALTTAQTNAQTALNKAGATAAELSAANTALVQAISDVGTSKKPGTDMTNINADLKAAIINAAAAMQNVEVVNTTAAGESLTTDQLWILQADQDELDAAIAAAQGAHATYQAAATDLKALNDALAKYKPQRGMVVPELPSISLDKAAVSLGVTDTDQVIVTLNHIDGTPTVAVTSDHSDIATAAYADGKITITGVKVGTAVITVTVGEITAKIDVTVKDTSATPAFAEGGDSYAMQKADEKAATFTLASAAAEGTTFAVYADETITVPVTGVTATVNGTTLTLTFETAPAEDVTYYVAATETGKFESERVQVSITAFETFTVTVDSNIQNGKVELDPADTTKAPVGSTVTVKVTPDANYALKAGSLKATYTPEGGAAQNIVLTAVEGQEGKYSFTMPGADVTITASFDTAYTVTFDLHGSTGTAPDAQKVAKDDKATEPEAPTWEGHKFLGWFTGTTGEGGAITLDETAYVFTTATVTKDITLYAKWASFETASATPDDIQAAVTAFQSEFYNKTAGTSTTLQTKFEGLIANDTGETPTEGTKAETNGFRWWFKVPGTNIPTNANTKVFLNDEEVSTDKVALSVGNNNFLQVPLYELKEDGLYVSLLLVGLEEPEQSETKGEGTLTFTVGDSATDELKAVVEVSTLKDLTLKEITADNQAYVTVEGQPDSTGGTSTYKLAFKQDIAAAIEKDDWSHLIRIYFNGAEKAGSPFDAETAYFTKKVYDGGKASYGFSKAESASGELGVYVDHTGKKKLTYSIVTSSRYGVCTIEFDITPYTKPADEESGGTGGGETPTNPTNAVANPASSQATTAPSTEPATVEPETTQPETTEPETTQPETTDEEVSAAPPATGEDGTDSTDELQDTESPAAGEDGTDSTDEPQDTDSPAAGEDGTESTDEPQDTQSPAAGEDGTDEPQDTQSPATGEDVDNSTTPTE